MRIGHCAVMAMCLLLAACDAGSGFNAYDKRLIKADSEPHNWLVDGGNYNGFHYSSLSDVNVETVKDLKPAWVFEFGTTRGQQSEPVIVDGVMYVTTAWSKVYALDAATGKQLWFYDPKVPGEYGIRPCCDVVNRGAAVYKDKVYVGAVDGRLIALDAKTGTEVWSTMTAGPNDMVNISGVPRVIKDKVIIGGGGAEFNVRGYVSAYDAETGKKLWRFYTVPGDPAKGPDNEPSDKVMEMATKTWGGEWWKYGGGGTVWDTIIYDAELDQIYFGTGNGLPWNPRYRTDNKGDNLFLASLIALDPDTGEYKWHYQENPRESWDYDANMPVVITDLTIAGQKRKVLMHAPKNGFVYVIDRTNGKLISAQAAVPSVTWTSGIDPVTGRPGEVPGMFYQEAPFLVAPWGARFWHRIAFSPKTNLLYFPTSDAAVVMLEDPNFKFEPELYNLGTIMDFDSGRKTFKGQRWIAAWDPVANREVWRSDSAGASLLVTGGDLIFQGRGSVIGQLAAMRTSDGQEVWSYDLPNAVSAAPVSYKVNGEQYIAVASGGGMGGARVPFPLPARAQQPGRLVAFKLNGTAILPPDPGPAPPANPAQLRLQEAEMTRAADIYERYCRRCHGFDANSPNVVPDLRRSAMLSNAESWKSVVIDGALKDNGMVSWAKFITPEDAELLRGFVSHYAEKLAEDIAAGRAPVETRKPRVAN